RQQGLLQLTYMDSKRYQCAFDWNRDKNLPVADPEKTILQPRNNLMCGLRILNNQMVVRHKPLLTESSYWVTLRPGHSSFEMFMKQMVNVPAACGARIKVEKPQLPDMTQATATQKTQVVVQPVPETAAEESIAPIIPPQTSSFPMSAFPVEEA